METGLSRSAIGLDQNVFFGAFIDFAFNIIKYWGPAARIKKFDTLKRTMNYKVRMPMNDPLHANDLSSDRSFFFT